jgi:hypothetical protein
LVDGFLPQSTQLVSASLHWMLFWTHCPQTSLCWYKQTEDRSIRDLSDSIMRWTQDCNYLFRRRRRGRWWRKTGG